jgi:CheY-like chemotaxis protein
MCSPILHVSFQSWMILIWGKKRKLDSWRYTSCIFHMQFKRSNESIKYIYFLDSWHIFLFKILMYSNSCWQWQESSRITGLGMQLKLTFLFIVFLYLYFLCVYVLISFVLAFIIYLFILPFFCLQEPNVNMIITDYSMPEMTGYELLKKVKVITVTKIFW